MLECGAHFQTGILTARNPDYPPNVVLCLAEIRQGPTAILGELQPRSNVARSSRRFCVQVVYKKAGLKGLKMDLSNAESTTDS